MQPAVYRVVASGGGPCELYLGEVSAADGLGLIDGAAAARVVHYGSSSYGVGLTLDGGHLTGGTAGPAGRLFLCRASVGSTPRSSGSRLPAW